MDSWNDAAKECWRPLIVLDIRLGRVIVGTHARARSLAHSWALRRQQGTLVVCIRETAGHVVLDETRRPSQLRWVVRDLAATH